MHFSGYRKRDVSRRNVIRVNVVDIKHKIDQTANQIEAKYLSSLSKRISAPHSGTHSPVLLT